MIRSRDYDTVVDLQGNLTTFLATWPGRVRRYSTDRRRRREVIRGSSGVMEYRADSYLRAAGGSGSATPRLKRRNRPAEGSSTAGLVAGGRWMGKTIPAGVLAEVARQLVDLFGFEVVVLGDSSDRAEAREVVERSLRAEVRSVAGEGGVAELIGRIERLDLLVSPDSGPAHLAAALGVPLVLVFTSTDWRLGFWPKGMEGALTSGRLDCRPCHRHGGDTCRRGDWSCRHGLIPSDITAMAASLMGLDTDAVPCGPVG